MSEYNNYQQKYLKYKNKYLNLKKQLGGGPLTESQKEFIKELKKKILECVYVNIPIPEPAPSKLTLTETQKKDIYSSTEKLLEEKEEEEDYVIYSKIWYKMTQNMEEFYNDYNPENIDSI